MPEYMWKCDEHGTFSLWMLLGKYTPTQDCPDCQKPCERYYGADSPFSAGSGLPHNEANPDDTRGKKWGRGSS